MIRLETVIGASLFFLVFGLLVQGIIGCGSCYGRTTSWDRIVPKVIDSVVAIDIVDGFEGSYDPLAGGSGFVISSDGYIVTNAHVVNIKNVIPMLDPEVWVRFQDGRKFISQGEFTDPLVDVAVIKINATNLPYLELEKYKKVKVGQEVASIGNPYPFEFNFSVGVVSNIESLMGDEVVIRHTCDISPGSSGSPLFNLQGKVIGINTALAPYHNAIYFAVHVDLIRISVYNLVDLDI